jgi:hypothetical protein
LQHQKPPIIVSSSSSKIIKGFVGQTTIRAPDAKVRCWNEAEWRVVFGVAQDDDEGLFKN